MAELVVASNRGPVQFEVDYDGALRPERGAGGMAAALGPALAGQGGTWVAAAISDGDRVAARRTSRSGGRRRVELLSGTVQLRSLVFDPREYQAYYNRVSNRTIWFLQHYLFDVPRHPRFDRSFRFAWNRYQNVNQRFAAACDEEADPGGTVFVQDYHLCLAPAMLRARRPDVGIGHFTHCPWADPGYLVDREHGTVLAGDGRTVHVRAYPLGIDRDDLRARLAGAEAQRQLRVVRELAARRKLIVRVDRMELSKNILRGLEGYAIFLEQNPRARQRVVHYALAYASRRDLAEYQSYTAEVKHAAEAINERFRTRTWEPVVLDLRDNYPRALAAMSLADVLVVNPVWDGMNLVAKEGPAVSDRDAVLVLSRNAGAADDLADGALLVSPFDTAELAEALAAAVAMPSDERAKRAKRLREGASALPPQDWFARQREDLQRAAALGDQLLGGAEGGQVADVVAGHHQGAGARGGQHLPDRRALVAPGRGAQLPDHAPGQDLEAEPLRHLAD